MNKFEFAIHIQWDGPYPAFRPEPGFWADHHFWAPEVYFIPEQLLYVRLLYKETLFPEEGVHGMLFRSLEGRLMLAMHAPNNQPDERAVFIEVEEKNGTLRRKA
ncbi:MAG TPA: hypothetical protein VL921_04735 [Candidatus Udaeobacter sp.]|nr:hypothetical protein [Candidatus Udaeobacter sp.]